MSRSHDLALFDLGGVLLTNGWDRHDRAAASERFSLDGDAFAQRHAMVVDAFEEGTLGIDEYLDETVFHQERDFTRDEFIDFMKGRSRAHAKPLDAVRALARRETHRLGILNNESRLLNEHRLDTFDLRGLFTLFLSSCHLGVRKPGARIFRMAADISGLAPERIAFFDDRPLNVECARREGFHGILVPAPTDLARLIDEHL